MFRIAASPARSQDTWSLAATTTERSEIVALIAISLFFSYSEFFSVQGVRAPGVFEPCRPCALRDTITASHHDCSRIGVQRQPRFERPHIVDRPAGLVSRRSTGYNGGW